MANIVRTKDSAAIPKTKIITDFGLTTPVIGWSSEGTGKGINLIARRPDQMFNNTPVNGIITIRERYTIIPGNDFYAAYFTSIPANRFERASVEFAANTVLVKLNQEA